MEISAREYVLIRKALEYGFVNSPDERETMEFILLKRKMDFLLHKAIKRGEHNGQ